MKSKIIGPIVIIAVLILGYGACQYNSLVGAEEDVNKAMSQVDNQLQRRNDLIPNLVETVKGFAKHETEVFSAIAEARANYANAKTPEAKIEADKQTTSALGRLLVISEQYPELKSNQNFLKLQDELAGTENRIAVARKDFNDVAAEYNKGIRRFPKSIFAGMLGFKTKPYFEAAAAAKEVPKVQFTK